jgi:AcrR family transcriptional regulator
VPKLSETEKEARRRRVLEGARRCFARYGYDGATVVRLEREIGLSRGAIFNWFPSKQELFLALAAEDNTRLHGLFAEEGFDALLEAVTEDEPDWLAVYLEFGRLLKADAGLRERWLAIAPPEARERSRARIETGQAGGRPAHRLVGRRARPVPRRGDRRDRVAARARLRPAGERPRRRLVTDAIGARNQEGRG